jgi:hypothetical protein
MTNYGVIVSPNTKKILRSMPSFPGGSITTWAEIRGGQSSPEITDGRCFCRVLEQYDVLFVGSRS